jgi:hypothetical protein
MILQIPIYSGREDFVAWHFNRNGLFKVKSAYHCQWPSKFGSRPRRVGADSVWKKLLELSVPSKVKFFAWRALRGCIPCHVILANKHITNAVSCPMCQTEVEDIKHTCRAREVWTSLGIWEHIERMMSVNRSGSILIQEVIRTGGEVRELNLGRAELILIGCWYIWWQRRQLVHGKSIQNSSRSALSIAAITTNYYATIKKGAMINQGWKKSSEGCLMINVDVVFYETVGSGSSGAVIRDSTGGFIAASVSYHIQWMRLQHKLMR